MTATRHNLRRSLGLSHAFALAALLASAPAWADFDAGVAAYDRGEYTRAYQEWQPLADKGDVAAMRNIGQLYRQGRGVPRDPAKAVYWFERAADGGLDRAMLNLAAMYLSGDGVKRDDTLAARWLARAAEMGSPIAAYNLGLLYEAGRGVPLDPNIAASLYTRAAEGGSEPAKERLAALRAGAPKLAEPTSKPASDTASTAAPTAPTANLPTIAAPEPAAPPVVALAPPTSDPVPVPAPRTTVTTNPKAPIVKPVVKPPAPPPPPPEPPIPPPNRTPTRSLPPGAAIAPSPAPPPPTPPAPSPVVVTPEATPSAAATADVTPAAPAPVTPLPAPVVAAAEPPVPTVPLAPAPPSGKPAADASAAPSGGSTGGFSTMALLNGLWQGIVDQGNKATPNPPSTSPEQGPGAQSSYEAGDALSGLLKVFKFGDTGPERQAVVAPVQPAMPQPVASETPRDPLAAGRQAFNDGKPDAAVALWMIEARAGNAEAQVLVGQQFQQGQGVPRDRITAAYWYTLAQRSGEPSAEKLLADFRPPLSRAERLEAEARANQFKPEPRS